MNSQLSVPEARNQASVDLRVGAGGGLRARERRGRAGGVGEFIEVGH